MQKAVDEFELLSSKKIPIKIKVFELVPYMESCSEMADFARRRSDQATDEIWLMQHFEVYTQGTACQQETLDGTDIPIVKSDRGGQITYHGPGQIIMYPLLKLKEHNLGVKSLVEKLEQSVINLLLDFGVKSDRREDAPGVYVNGAKISALGLRIRRGTSYHGLSFNIDMDLTPFKNIHPCGYKGLEVIQLADLIDIKNISEIQNRLVAGFVALL